MKAFLIFLCILACLLTGCAQEPEQTPPPTTEAVITEPVTEAPTEAPTEPPEPKLGWVTEGEDTYYYAEEDVMYTGWMFLDGKEYYFREDGRMARGEVEIDGKKYHFVSDGSRIILVNPWNFIPDDFEVNVDHLPGWGYYADVSCHEDLVQMLADCKAAGYYPAFASSFRTHGDQQWLYDRKVNYYLSMGWDEESAKKEAGTIVAVPGTSEHELGLAFDLVDAGYTELNELQESTPTQQWLMAHSWEYGFILRYPSSKSEYTGIIYEPWHYRYVGKELAKELWELDMCLEEYIASLTE